MATSILFLLVAVGHLVRIIMGWKVTVGTFEMPMWLSGAVIVLCVGLSIGMWMCSCCKGQCEAAVPPQPKA